MLGLINLLKIDIDRLAIVEELEKHPHYPSLLSISDAFTSFNISNGAFKASIDDIDVLPLPFLAYSDISGGNFVVVEGLNSKEVIVSNEKWRRHKLSRAQFNKYYSGVVLVLEPQR